MSSKKPAKGKGSQQRVNLNVQGLYGEQLEEVRMLLGLNSKADAARYLISRGMEAMAGQLNTLRMFRKMEHAFSPQELLPFAREMGLFPNQRKDT